MGREHSIEFERGMIVAIMFSKAFRQYCLGKFRDNYFADPDLYLIYDHILRLYSKGSIITWIALEDSIRRDTNLSDGRVETLTQLTGALSAVPDEHAKSYLMSVKDNVKEHVSETIVIESMKNAFMSLKEKNLQLAFEALRDLDRRCEFVEGEQHGFVAALNNMDKEEEIWTPGIRTGITGINTDTQQRAMIDDYLFFNGMSRGHLAFIQGSSNLGKTTLSIDCALFHMLTGMRVAFFSLEMTRQYLNVRVYSALGNIASNDFKTMRKEDIQQTVQNELSKFAYAKDIEWIEYWQRPCTPRAIAADLSRMHNEGVAPDVIYIDYLELMQSDFKGHMQDWERIEQNSRELRGLAGEYDCLVIANSQSNKQALVQGSSGFTAGRSYGKIQVCDYNLALNRIDEDVSSGVGKTALFYITIDKNRFGKNNITLLLDQADMDKARFFDVVAAAQNPTGAVI